MGFWSAIGGALSSFASSVVSTVSSVFSKASSVFIGGVQSFVEKFSPVLQKAVDFISNIAQSFNLITKEENCEEIGVKAKKSEKQMEEFNSKQEYIRHLRENVTLSKDEVKNLSKEEKAAYSSTGAYILTTGIAEKVGVDNIPLEFWDQGMKSNLNSKEIKEILVAFKSLGINLGNFSNYYIGALSFGERIQTTDAITTGLKVANPLLSEDEIDNKLNESFKQN